MLFYAFICWEKRPTYVFWVWVHSTLCPMGFERHSQIDHGPTVNRTCVTPETRTACTRLRCWQAHLNILLSKSSRPSMKQPWLQWVFHWPIGSCDEVNINQNLRLKWMQPKPCRAHIRTQLGMNFNWGLWWAPFRWGFMSQTTLIQVGGLKFTATVARCL